jgi:prephenate dehydrogenase
MAHLIQRVTILGTGLIGGSFALAVRKFMPDIKVSGWDREEVVREAQSRGAIHHAHSGELAPAISNTARADHGRMQH